MARRGRPKGVKVDLGQLYRQWAGMPVAVPLRDAAVEMHCVVRNVANYYGIPTLLVEPLRGSGAMRVRVSEIRLLQPRSDADADVIDSMRVWAAVARETPPHMLPDASAVLLRAIDLWEVTYAQVGGYDPSNGGVVSGPAASRPPSLDDL